MAHTVASSHISSADVDVDVDVTLHSSAIGVEVDETPATGTVTLPNPKVGPYTKPDEPVNVGMA